MYQPCFTKNAEEPGGRGGVCKKGIVSYTLVANHVPINAEIIGANDHESHYVFDILFNNTTDIQPEVHSTDTHGTNEVNFALLHMFGYQFAPRYRDIYDKVGDALYGSKHPSQYEEDMVLRPIRKLSPALIIERVEYSADHGVVSLEDDHAEHHRAQAERLCAERTRRGAPCGNMTTFSAACPCLTTLTPPPSQAPCPAGAQPGRESPSAAPRRLARQLRQAAIQDRAVSTIWGECARLLTNCIIYYNAHALIQPPGL